MLGIYDYDLITYKAAFAGETRLVEVTHKPTGRRKIFKNKTEFLGRGKKVGGWLGEINKARESKGQSPFNAEDFEVETIREVEPLEHVLSTTKRMINNINKAAGVEKYCGYLGDGNGFRYDLSTLWEYKGNRKDVIRPIYKTEVAEYILKHHNAKKDSHYEADDRVIMKAIEVGVDNSVVITADKDSYGCPVRVFNPERSDEGIVDCRGFGEIYRGGSRKDAVRGRGRKFFYWQVACGDTTDNYKANCFSDVQWADLKALDALIDCKNDKEALATIVDIYKMLYPEPKEVEGWRGDIILIDWEYVLNEVWHMARMRRWEGDEVTASEVLKKMGIT